MGSLHLCLFPVPTSSLLSAKHLTELDQYSMHGIVFSLFPICSWDAYLSNSKFYIMYSRTVICVSVYIYISSYLLARLKPQGQKQVTTIKHAREEPHGLRQADGQNSTPKPQQPRSRICLILVQLLQMMMVAWNEITHSQQIWDVSPVSFAVALQPESVQEHGVCNDLALHHESIFRPSIIHQALPAGARARIFGPTRARGICGFKTLQGKGLCSIFKHVEVLFHPLSACSTILILTY